MGLELVGLNVLAAASFAFAQEPAERPAPPPEEFMARLADFAKSAPPPQPLRGDHSITGRVVTEAGEPLAGVLVRARSSRRYDFGNERRPFDDEPPPEDTLERSLRSSVNWFYWRRAETFEVKTAADGTFKLDRLADVRFDVEAWRDGFSVEALGAQWHRSISVGVDSSVDFVAIPIVAFRVDLRLPDGSMPERARLTLDRFGSRRMSESQTWTPKTPLLKLPAGDWNVTALIAHDSFTVQADDDGIFASRKTLITATPKPGAPEATEVVRIDLLGIPGIEGSISYPTDTPFPYMHVVAVRLEPGEEPDPALLRESRSRGARLVASELVQSSSDRGHVFRIGRIEAGRWLVGVLDYGSEASLATTVVEVGAGVSRVDFKLPPRESRPELLVRVFDPNGVPVRDCQITYLATITRPNSSPSRQTGDPMPRRTIDGAFAIERVRLGTGCTLFVENPRFGTKALPVPEDAKELELRFDAPAVPKLHVTGVHEHAAGRRIEVEVEAADGEEPGYGRQLPKIDGSAIAADETVALGSLQPGAWRVRLLCATEGRNRPYFDGFEVAAATFELAAGPQEITLPFPELTTLRLAVAAGSKESFSIAPVEATSTHRNPQWQGAKPDADGVVTFKDLPPGLYEASTTGGRTMAVDVPSRNLVAFVAEAVNALRVVVADSKGGLAKAGLRTGDLVVAIDGREFASRQELDQVRQMLRDEEVTLTVERKGERFEVVIARSLLTDERAAGGRLRDASH